MLKANSVATNEDTINSSLNDKDKISEVKESETQEMDTSMEKEKLKEDNERLKVDIEVLSKKLHDAVNRIGNLEKALESQSKEEPLTNNPSLTPSLTYSTTTTTTTTTTSSIQTGGKTFISSSSETPVTTDAGIVIKMKDLENTIDILNRRLLEEVEKRSELETSHSALVQETEDLTVKLFEEAQSMVAIERKENFEKEKQIKNLKSIIDEKDQIIQALMEENRTLKIFIQNNSNKLSDSNSETSSIFNNMDEADNENNKENEDNKDNNKKKNRISIRTRSLSNATEILSATQFSPINSILNVEGDSPDATYKTFAYQTINRELHFDNKNPYYNEMYNFIKYKHYDVLEHSKFTKRCIAEEIDPCLDFQPVNPNLITISTKLSHYNFVRKIVKACKDNTLIIKNLYGYPEITETSPTSENNEPKIIKNTNISCSLCLRSHLPLPLNVCYLDEDDRELQMNEKIQNQTPSVYVCRYCKERLLSAYDFYGYFKFVKNYLKDNKAYEKPTEYCHNLFGDLLRIRERVYWAKFGLVGKDYGVNTSLYK